MPLPEMQITKIVEDQQLVFGWASVVADSEGALVVDSQGDVIEPNDLEDAVYDFMLESRASGDSHLGDAPWHVVESLMLTKEKAAAMGMDAPHAGWWVGVKIDDPETFAKVKTGERAMFSIEGTAAAVDVEYEEADTVPAATPAMKAGQQSVINVVPEITFSQPAPQVNVYPAQMRRNIIRDPETGQIVAIEEQSAA